VAARVGAVIVLRALRFAAWLLVAAFLADLLRRCWIVEAWTIFPIAALALWLALWRTRSAWRALRRRRDVPFIRPRGPGFPEQRRRSIR